jgi:hypothetical protein
VEKKARKIFNKNHDIVRNQELEFFFFFSFKKYLEYIQISHYLSDSLRGRMYPSRACSIPQRFLEVGYKAAQADWKWLNWLRWLILPFNMPENLPNQQVMTFPFIRPF